MWLLSGKEFKGLKLVDFLTSWEGCLSGVHRISRSSVPWEPPHQDVMKFNVDGVSRGKLGPVGIGGVLRNHSCLTLLVFIESGMRDSNETKLFSIRRTLTIRSMDSLRAWVTGN